MLRQTGNEEQVLDRTAEVAATIAEEGLRYVSDSAPGYTRKRTGATFSYYEKDGKRITDAAVSRHPMIPTGIDGERGRWERPPFLVHQLRVPKLKPMLGPPP
ncbi:MULTISPECIES: hypothetical protein [unclassified Bradyrhizobium]|uniref:hypothetical protein n=1 Tax=unclassified Bradyrhizobium TaxID=2631580 RepID=UPI0020B3F5A0|nr:MULTISPECIES: hypothetical protein [unclassified Bradyrhizobium]MCP3402006.1 hypothetical protein [Bradyrhizobium sp. CCGB20]MCP3410491.1 hypothetical protein [Bradyrhizobium sp. CCGB01]